MWRDGRAKQEQMLCDIQIISRYYSHSHSYSYSHLTLPIASCAHASLTLLLPSSCTERRLLCGLLGGVGVSLPTRRRALVRSCPTYLQPPACSSVRVPDFARIARRAGWARVPGWFAGALGRGIGMRFGRCVGIAVWVCGVLLRGCGLRLWVCWEVGLWALRKGGGVEMEVRRLRQVELGGRVGCARRLWEVVHLIY